MKLFANKLIEFKAEKAKFQLKAYICRQMQQLEQITTNVQLDFPNAFELMTLKTFCVVDLGIKKA